MKGQFRIDTMYAYICTDLDGSEGVPALNPNKDGVVMPLMGAGMDRMLSLRPYAVHIAKTMGRKVTLCKFTTREEVEVFEP